MTTIERVRAEIEQEFRDIGMDGTYEWDIIQEAFDKYAEQEPCRVKNELKVELNELEPCDDADAEYDKAYDAYLALVNADVKEPCDDAISRQAVLEIIDGWYDNNRDTENIEDLIILITYMASVRPQEQTGHWDKSCRCSECGYGIVETEKLSGKYKFCPNCGARMVEPQESEDKG